MGEQLDSDSPLDCSHLVAVAAIAQGDLDHLRAVLEDWHAGGQQLPLDLMRSGRIWGLAECAHAVGDKDAAQILYEQLAPYDGQLLVYAFQFICASAAFTLGLLARPSTNTIAQSVITPTRSPSRNRAEPRPRRAHPSGARTGRLVVPRRLGDAQSPANARGSPR